jgi:Fe-S cluster biosynthesis and repair protein YggX
MSFLELNDGYPVEEVREIAYENETTLLGNNFYTLINLYFGSILENYSDGLLISLYFSSICEELFNELMSKAHTKKTSNSWQNLTSEKKKEMMTDVYRKNLKQMLNRFKEKYPYSLFEELGLLDRKDLVEKFKLVYPEDIFVEKLIKILDLFIIKVKVGVGY